MVDRETIREPGRFPRGSLATRPTSGADPGSPLAPSPGRASTACDRAGLGPPSSPPQTDERGLRPPAGGGPARPAAPIAHPCGVPPDPRAVRSTASRQAHTVSREQLLALGATPTWISHQVTSGRWLRLFPGVYVTHTGEPSWPTRAAGSLLYAGAGAALSHAAAAFRHGFRRTPPDLIEVSVPHRRRVVVQPGLAVNRRWSMPPAGGMPRTVLPAHTVLDLVARCTGIDDVVGCVCAAVRARVHPSEILAALHARGRATHRALLEEIVGEVADGVESPLERRFHHDVEQRHGLPRSRLQVRERVGSGWIRADALYEGLGVRAELDGALAHPGGRTDADTWRDNAVLVERGDLTLRYRWYHVAVIPCETARQVEAALRVCGWTGRAHPCSPGCAVGREAG